MIQISNAAVFLMDMRCEAAGFFSADSYHELHEFASCITQRDSEKRIGYAPLCNELNMNRIWPNSN